MDEAVDQVMGRSSSETGADKAVAIRRSQQKERARLQQDITQSQQAIASLNEQRSPIAAEVRKVEAEVGPIKYIAAFVYGETDQTILEKAVTWVIVILIVVFDPLAVILLLASQISFQNFRKQLEEDKFGEWTENDFEQLAQETFTEGDSPEDPDNIVEGQPTVTEQDEMSRDRAVEVAKTYIPEKSVLEQHPYLTQPFKHFENLEPLVYKAEGDSLTTESNLDIVEEATVTDIPDMERPGDYITPPQDITEEVMQQVLEEQSHEIKPVANGEYVFINGQAYHRGSVPSDMVSYVQNEEQKDSSLWSKTIYSEKK
jgi:hypothetical protein